MQLTVTYWLTLVLMVVGYYLGLLVIMADIVPVGYYYSLSYMFTCLLGCYYTTLIHCLLIVVSYYITSLIGVTLVVCLLITFIDYYIHTYNCTCRYCLLLIVIHVLYSDIYTCVGYILTYYFYNYITCQHITHLTYTLFVHSLTYLPRLLVSFIFTSLYYLFMSSLLIYIYLVLIICILGH